MIGRKFGHWTPIRPAPQFDDAKHSFWLCECVCNTQKVVRGDQLRSGESTSCGCHKNMDHGHTSRRLPGRGSAEWKAYDSAKQLCTNPKRKEFQYYGGRGIEFLFGSFQEFLS